MNTKRFAIIVAGGKGLRMGNEIPKQFLEVAGKPILMHTITRFFECKPSIQIILVLPKVQFEFWEELCEKYKFTISHTVVAGGNTRTDSVRNGLNTIKNNGLVAVHDGVRPFATEELINQSFEVAEKKGSAIAAVPLKDSIRKMIDNNESESLNRSNYQLVQTPQTFQIKLLKEAYAKAENSTQTFTDDASVVEAIGHKVSLVRGSYQNIKITTPEDLIFAEAILKNF